MHTGQVGVQGLQGPAIDPRISQPVSQAWPANAPTAGNVQPVNPPPRPPFTYYHPEVRKKSWSNCLEDFCCMYDIHSDWYKLKGKGFWCVLFLLLLYLIAIVIVVAVAVVAPACCILMKLCKGGESCRPETPQQSTSSGGPGCILIPTVV